MEIFELQLVSGQKRCAFNDGCDCPVKPRSVFEVSHSFAVGHPGLKRRDVKHHYPWSIIWEKNQKVGLSGNHINIVGR